MEGRIAVVVGEVEAAHDRLYLKLFLCAYLRVAESIYSWWLGIVELRRRAVAIE